MFNLGRETNMDTFNWNVARTMVKSIFQRYWHVSDEVKAVHVTIEKPANYVRRVSASILIDQPLEEIWQVCLQYGRLAEFIPNLVRSDVIKTPPGEGTGTRLYQEGAQNILGMQFRASLTMDMHETIEDDDEKLGRRVINFKLVESAMLKKFSGAWTLQGCKRASSNSDNRPCSYVTKLSYEVTVSPRVRLPVAAVLVEWRIRVDLPVNLVAIKHHIEGLSSDCTPLDVLDHGNTKLVDPSCPSPTDSEGGSVDGDNTLDAYLLPPNTGAEMEDEILVQA